MILIDYLVNSENYEIILWFVDLWNIILHLELIQLLGYEIIYEFVIVKSWEINCYLWIWSYAVYYSNSFVCLNYNPWAVIITYEFCILMNIMHVHELFMTKLFILC